MRFAWPLALLASTAGLSQNTAARFKQYAVVSDSAIASRVGADILAKGGNAVDAAVSTGFALAVTHPTAGNLGGGGFMLVRLTNGQAVAIDYRERAPLAATRGMYLDASGNVIPDLSLKGWKASGVPGTVAGLWEAHKRFGKLPWKALVEPAVQLADKGFAVSFDLAAGLKGMSRTFQAFPESFRIFNRDGRFFEWGEKLVQKDLARTLRRIRDKGPVGFYRGETALVLAEEMRAHGGLITEQDLAEYKVALREPLKGTYRGHEILTMPPPSSGGIALLQMLAMLEGFDLKSMGSGSSAAYHLMLEAMKRAFADRAVHLGDPDFVRVPVANLLEAAYLARLRATIDLEKATPSSQIQAGSFHDPLTSTPGPSSSWARGGESLVPKEGEHTTHFSIIDGEGSAVANTYTLNSGYGSGVVPKGLGFLLNNEMDDFAAKPGVPNLYGLIQGEANAIQPGKRPLSSMTPTIVVKDGRLAYVIGSPGGPTIINTVLQTILNVADFGMNIQRAVGAPRIHHQWLPDEVRFEPLGLNPDARAALEKKGHKFAARAGSMGSCMSLAVDPTTGHRLAGVDPRSEDAGAAGG